MRRLSAILVMACLGLWLPGCSLFKKNTGGGGGDSGPNPLPPPKFPTGDSKPDPLSGQSRATGGSGLLAGRVLDDNAHPPVGTSILVVSADAKNDSAGKEAAVDGQGYFTIENLNRGGQYKLIARGKQGDRAIAGTYFATAPNIHVLIRMKEEFVTSTTPAVPGPYTTLDDNNKHEPLAPRETKDRSPNTWQPSDGVKVAGAEIALPPMHVAAPADGFKQNGGAVIPPPLAIPSINVGPPKASIPQLTPAVPTNVPPRPTDGANNFGPVKVPSCVLVGNRVDNFALGDAFNDQPWEFKTDRKGKLVLLDFWGSWCPPCRKSVPLLVNLQNKYGNKGLEVIGIAYERAKTRDQKTDQVNKVCKEMQINYRQLLGSSEKSDIAAQLDVQNLPTFVLLDADGNQIWRKEGELSNTYDELSRLLDSRLGPSPVN